MRTPDEISAWTDTAAKYWAPNFPEPTPQPPATREGTEFYGAVPMLGASHVEVPLGEKGVYALRFLVGRKNKSLAPQAGVQRVTAHVVHAKKNKVVGYLTAFIVGKLEGLATLESLLPSLSDINADLGLAMAAMVDTHVTPAGLLDHGLALSGVLHLEMLEISPRCKVKGLGVLALKELCQQLVARKKVSLLTYRPYPMQFANEHALGTQYSHVPASVAVFQRFVAAQAALSIHYAKALNSSRLPETDYFIVAFEEGDLALAFNTLLKKWALLPQRSAVDLY